MTDTLDLPDYRDLDTDVADRFERIKNRPVVLAVDHLGKVFGEGQDSVLALKDIDFQVHRREFICVIGPSGCGKSTLIRILAGLDYPTSGQVLLDDERVEGPSPDRGMVFQGYTLFPWLTVKRNVMFGLQMTGHGSTTAEAEALQWIELVGLEITGGYDTSGYVSSTAADSNSRFCPRAPHFPWHPSACSVGHPPPTGASAAARTLASKLRPPCRTRD